MASSLANRASPPFFHDKRNISSYLERYLHALRLFPESYDAILFIISWLKTTLGDEPFTQLLAPLITLPKETPVSSSLHKAVAKLLTEKKFYMNLRQVEAVTRDRSSYLCWAALNNDSGSWQPEALAAAIGIEPAEAKRLIRDFAAVKLLKRQRDGSHKCPVAGAIIEYPRLGILRASLRGFANCFPLLSLNVSTV